MYEEIPLIRRLKYEADLYGFEELERRINNASEYFTPHVQRICDLALSPGHNDDAPLKFWKQVIKEQEEWKKAVKEKQEKENQESKEKKLPDINFESFKEYYETNIKDGLIAKKYEVFELTERTLAYRRRRHAPVYNKVNAQFLRELVENPYFVRLRLIEVLMLLTYFDKSDPGCFYNATFFTQNYLCTLIGDSELFIHEISRRIEDTETKSSNDTLASAFLIAQNHTSVSSLTTQLPKVKTEKDRQELVPPMWKKYLSDWESETNLQAKNKECFISMGSVLGNPHAAYISYIAMKEQVGKLRLEEYSPADEKLFPLELEGDHYRDSLFYYVHANNDRPVFHNGFVRTKYKNITVKKPQRIIVLPYVRNEKGEREVRKYDAKSHNTSYALVMYKHSELNNKHYLVLGGLFSSDTMSAGKLLVDSAINYDPRRANAIQKRTGKYPIYIAIVKTRLKKNHKEMDGLDKINTAEVVDSFYFYYSKENKTWEQD
jgi:hypothetical protein